MRVLLFGGTSEGRELALWLSGLGVSVTACAATRYGGDLLPRAEGIRPLVGRMDQGRMAEEMRRGGYDCVIDATHPYAAEATENIAGAAKETGVKILRFVRDGGDIGKDCAMAADMRGAAARCQSLEGNILLTTGSKELDAFSSPALFARCFPRVLPDVASLTRCLELGFPRRNILCMQGPFSKALNVAIIKQYDIKVLVTKITGADGGFREKLEAAEETGCKTVVIERPLRERGYAMPEIKDAIDGLIKAEGGGKGGY